MTERPSPELRQLAARLFAAGRAERPGPALGRRLLLIDPRLVDARATRHEQLPARTSPLPASAGGVSGPRFARALAAAALVAGCVGVWVVSRPESGPVSISREHVANRARAAAPTPFAEAPTHVEAPTQIAPSPRVHAEPSAPTLAPAAHAPPARSGSRPLPTSAPPTAARSASRAAAPAASVSTPPAAAASGAAAPAAATSPESSRGSASPPSLTLLGELDLLKRARTALRSGDARQALALLDTHGRERGGSELIAEATLLRIEALSVLGERVTASDLATRFVRDNPHSALSDRAKSFIGVGTPRSP